jgi:hypothetical protein
MTDSLELHACEILAMATSEADDATLSQVPLG